MGLFSKRADENVFANPADIEVTAPAFQSALPIPVGLKYEPGLKLSTALAERKISSIAKRDWAKEAGLTPGEQFTLAGLVEVPVDGLYQLQLAVHGDANLFVDNRSLAEFPQQASKQQYALLPLEKGWHEIKAVARLADSMRFRLRFGGAGCRSIGAPAFHVPP